MNPTHIIFSRERLMFRVEGRQFEFWGADVDVSVLDESPRSSLIRRWMRWRAGEITDLEMVAPVGDTAHDG